MDQPTLEEVITSIEILNYIKPGNFEESKFFLAKLQESNFAWVIANELLNKNKDLCSSYFGAQTMRIKIQLHFDELPVDFHLSLKDSLKTHLLKVDANTNPAVSKQLCIALADLFCHMVQWTNSLGEIINTFSETTQHIVMLLKVLKYIPEEFANKSLRLGVNRKTHIFGELEQYRLIVIEVLERSLEMNTDSVYVGALACLDAWFMLNIFRDNDLQHTNVIKLVYQVLEQPGDYSENLFKEAVKCATDFFSFSIHRTPTLISLFQIRNYTLDGVYSQCEKNKIDYCLEYNNIFCEMASALMPYVLKSPCSNFEGTLGDVRTLHLLLLTARTSRECCAAVLSVLADVTDHIRSPGSDDSTRQLTPLFEDLIEVMTRHCATSDVVDEKSLSSFREEVFYVMEQIRVFVDVESLFQKLLMRLSELLTQQTNSNEAEAVLYIISSLVKFVNTDSGNNAYWTEQLLTKVILPNVRQALPSFKCVSFTLFGELCRWASQRPEIIDLMIIEMTYFITYTDIDSKDDLQLAALDAGLHSLSIFAKRSPGQILVENHWSMIIGLCRRLPQLGFFTEEMVPFYESLGRCLAIPFHMEALNELIQSHSPEQLAQKLYEVSSLNVEVIDRLISTGTNNREVKHMCNPCVWIDNVSALLTSLVRQVTGKHDTRDSDSSLTVVSDNVSRDTIKETRLPYVNALYAVFEQYLWPTVSRLIEYFLGDGHTLERVVRVLRYGQRSFQMLTKPLLANIAEKCVVAYAHSRESCFLYIGGILVDEFGDDRDCVCGLVNMFHSFSSTALQILAGDGLDNNPHTTEDLFRLMVRLVQHCSTMFLAWQELQLAQLLAMAVRSLSGSMIDAKMLGLRFLVETMASVGHRSRPVLGIAGDGSSGDVGHGRVATDDGTVAIVTDRITSWLVNDNGLQSILVAIIHLCRWSPEEVVEEELGSDMADLVINVRTLIDTQRFMAAFDHALRQVGVARRDGLLYANDEQIAQFRDSLLQDKLVLRGIEDFAKLFT